jgi:hypothetical protein
MRLWRSVQRVLLALLLFVILFYGGDYLVLRYRASNHGNALGSVLVKRTLAVRLKSNKIEYTALDPVNRVCTNSIFPQLGYSPCWYVRRHPREQIDD